MNFNSLVEQLEAIAKCGKPVNDIAAQAREVLDLADVQQQTQLKADLKAWANTELDNDFGLFPASRSALRSAADRKVVLNAVLKALSPPPSMTVGSSRQ
jgi:hypothetical protein